MEEIRDGMSRRVKERKWNEKEGENEGINEERMERESN